MIERFVVAAFACWSVAASPAYGQSRNTDESSIRAERARSNRAIAEHDVDAVARVLLPEYVGVSSGNLRTVGRAAARASYARNFASRPGIVFIRTPRAITVNAAWGQAGESGRWTGRWSSANGVVRVGGEYFAKWKKLDGAWRLLAETFVQTTCTGGRYCDAPPAVATTAPTLGLSHVYVSVDSGTFAAIATSPFLREELGAFETRTTTRADGVTYTGAYLYGRETYVELQQPSPTNAADLAQLYLGTDAQGDIHTSMERLANGGIRTGFGRNTRRREESDIPWFYASQVIPNLAEVDRASRFRMFILEWHADFLRNWFPDRPADSTGVSRAEYLAPLWKPHRYLRDVVGIVFALDSTETARMTERLSMLGYAIRRNADTVHAVGAGLTVSTVPSTPARHGTVALRLSLQRPKSGQQVYRLGASELRFEDGGEAIWIFR